MVQNRAGPTERGFDNRNGGVWLHKAFGIPPDGQGATEFGVCLFFFVCFLLDSSLSVHNLYLPSL